MKVNELRIQNFRCISSAALETHPQLNIITGENAAGKTSLLESLYFLGRGRSFRAGQTRDLIGPDQDVFTLFAQFETGSGVSHRAGAEAGREERIFRLDGATAQASDMAGLLPVQAIDPEVHELIQGGPEFRRRFLDWGLFHVKPEFLGVWRRYRKALKQRNAGLRQGLRGSALQVWDQELASAGEEVTQQRRIYLDGYLPVLQKLATEYLDYSLEVKLRQGWKSDLSLAEALARQELSEDGAPGTYAGPHRAELRLETDGVALRHRLSRGQQKFLAALMTVAQVLHLAEEQNRPVVLLVDDPAAELDAGRQAALLELLRRVPGQLFVTALQTAQIPWAKDGTLFHVEHGQLTQQS